MNSQIRLSVCNKCGLVYSIDIKNDKENILFGENIFSNEELLTSLSTLVDKNIVVVYIFKGICQNCQNKGGEK